MNVNMNTGYLEIIIGPMKSGKTSKLIEIYKQYKYCNIEVCVINHSSDKRYSTTKLTSHDGHNIPCHNIDLLKEMFTEETIINIKNANVILINEGQFFKDLIFYTRVMLDMKKNIYIAGLDGDYSRKKIGSILDLIPICDQVTKLTAICSICKNGTKAIFSKRVTNETEQIVIGNDNYKPVCRKCFWIN